MKFSCFISWRKINYGFTSRFENVTAKSLEGSRFASCTTTCRLGCYSRVRGGLTKLLCRAHVVNYHKFTRPTNAQQEHNEQQNNILRRLTSFWHACRRRHPSLAALLHSLLCSRLNNQVECRRASGVNPFNLRYSAAGDVARETPKQFNLGTSHELSAKVQTSVCG